MTLNCCDSRMTDPMVMLFCFRMVKKANGEVLKLRYFRSYYGTSSDFNRFFNQTVDARVTGEALTSTHFH